MKTAKSMRSRIKTAAMGFSTVAGFICISGLIAKVPNSRVGEAISFSCGMIVALLFASLIEWSIHRSIHHSTGPALRQISAIHLQHHEEPHRRYVMRFRSLSDVGPQVTKERFHKKLATYLLQVLVYVSIGATFVCLPGWLLSENWHYVGGMTLVTLVFSNLLITVHDIVHRPQDYPLIKGSSWVTFLTKRHLIHHSTPSVNFNFFVPLADLAFGTYRRVSYAGGAPNAPNEENDIDQNNCINASTTIVFQCDNASRYRVKQAEHNLGSHPIADR